MNELRWILIGFGIVLLAGIYLWGRRGGRSTVASDDAVVRVRPEPSVQPSVQARHVEEPVHSDAFADGGPGVSPMPARHEEPVITAVRPASRPAEPSRTASEEPEETVHHKPSPSDSWRGRVEPTFSEGPPTEELPVRHADPGAPAPTLSLSDSPPPKRIERRKILALRLAASPQRIEGAKLLEMLTADSLQHGRYDVFHRLHEDGATSIFSVASMVEPGTFDLEKMPSMSYPGITLFAQLPGPVPGMHALNELVACARRLQQSLGGTLQDDRGVPLTVHRIERLRQEVREFERPSGATGRSSSVSPSTSP
jgi:cell division protein ZipA